MAKLICSVVKKTQDHDGKEEEVNQPTAHLSFIQQEPQ